jgi:uncharacterized membrane protein YgcG
MSNRLSREAAVQAAVGDRLRIPGSVKHLSHRTGEILEVRGDAGGPPYLVRFGDGRIKLVHPAFSSVVVLPTIPQGTAAKPARPVRQEPMPGSCILILIYIPIMIGVCIIAGTMLTSSSAKTGFFFLAAVALTTAVVLVVRVRTWVRAGSPAPFARDYLRSVTVTAVLAGATAVACSLMIHLVDTAGDGKRCVNGHTMTVLPASACQNPAAQGGSDSGDGHGEYVETDPEWYYGGTGTQIGQQVQGGSLTPPSDSGDGSGTGGGGGDSGGDDGGGDVGGGDGGD